MRILGVRVCSIFNKFFDGLPIRLSIIWKNRGPWAKLFEGIKKTIKKFIIIKYFIIFPSLSVE